MKISQLVQRTHVPKETIHYYIREGILPKPRKWGKNVADYDEGYVERIQLIKELQDGRFLPLSLIRRILKHQKSSQEAQSLLRLRNEYFRPVDHLLPNEVVGEEAFGEATGLRQKWLAKMEEWGIITPESRDGEKVYSQDDVSLGKSIVDMDRIGLGPKDGFDPEALRHYCDLFRDIVIMAHNNYLKTTLGRLPPHEFSKRIVKAREIMSVFFYHLYRKISRAEWRRILSAVEAEREGVDT